VLSLAETYMAIATANLKSEQKRTKILNLKIGVGINLYNKK